MEKICGIYKITSPSGKIYVGQSKDIHGRWWYYKKLKASSQTKLFNSLQKYGAENHKFEILEECPKEQLNDREIHYIKLFDTFNTDKGLNLRSGGEQNVMVSDETRKRLSESLMGRPAWNKGIPLSDEAKKIISQKLTGVKLSEERRESISFGLKGRVISEEHRKNLSLANKGKPSSGKGKKRSAETIEKVASRLRGQKRTEEQKQRMRQAHLGFRHTSESKKKMSDGLRNRYKNGWTVNRGLGFLGKKHSEETKEKIRKHRLAHLQNLAEK